jgi:hypothetical protein
MGFVTWIIFAVVILSIIGQGWNVFASSVLRGAQKVIITVRPIIDDSTKELNQPLDNLTNSIQSILNI